MTFRVCRCPDCRGTGECAQCKGSGKLGASIENVTLNKDSAFYPELSELQKDAKRVIRQASELTKMNPKRAGSYRIQLESTLKSINLLAEEACEV